MRGAPFFLVLIIVLPVIVGAIAPASAAAVMNTTGTKGPGEVSISVSPQVSGTYISGDEITFFGTNTHSRTTYLFITGPGLSSSGSRIDNDDSGFFPVTDGVVSTFSTVSVGIDDTWSLAWDSKKRALDSGMYTIYAVSTPRDKNHLGNAIYDSIAINISAPALTASARPSTAVEGEIVTISGSATGHPGPGIAIWVIGPQYSNRYVVEPDTDGSYSLELDSTATNMFKGDYHVFVEHPSTDDAFDLDLNGDYVFNNRIRSNIFTFRGNGRLYGQAAYTAFSAATNGPAVEDVIVPVTFSMKAKPDTTMITINTSGAANASYLPGDKITFYGTNTATRITYLFITGPGLLPEGSQIQSIHPEQYPVDDGIASSFQAVEVGDDNTWQWIWDTRTTDLDDGVYEIYAVSAPRDRDHRGDTKSNQTVVSFSKPAAAVSLSPAVTSLPAVTTVQTTTAGNGTLSGIFTIPFVKGEGSFPYATAVVASGIVFLGGAGGAVVLLRKRRNKAVLHNSPGDTRILPAHGGAPDLATGTGIPVTGNGLPLPGNNGIAAQEIPGGAFPEELAGKYSGISAIGSGGFAMVYSAYRVSDNERVAVKIPLRSNERTGKSFLHEIRVWETMHHPNIVEVKTANILPVPYVEMEYIPGSLEAMKKPADVVQAARIIHDITEGIRYAHERRCIHRDIKPQNILLTEDMVPKIADWGISKILEDNSKKTTVAGFSLSYAAPEQIAPEKFGSTDERTDIYQIGAVFYELVTGITPFDDESMMELVSQITTDDPILPSDLNPDAAAVERIILTCLAKDKDQRYQSAGELRDTLSAYLDTVGWGLFEDGL